MTRSLRRGHRLLVSALAPLAILVFIASLAVREVSEGVPEPLPEDLTRAMGRAPDQPEAGPPADRRAGHEGYRSWTGPGLDVGMVLDEEPPRIDLVVHDEIAFPDLLLYWQAADPAGQTAPSSKSLLLGGVAGVGSTRLELSHPLPPGGYLVLYSLGHGDIVGRLPVAAAGEAI